MSKPLKNVGKWLNDVFGGSHKAISEALTADQYNTFVNEAEKLAPEDSADGGDDDGDGNQGGASNSEGDGKTDGALSIEQRLQNLEQTLGATQKDLEAEKKKNSDLQGKLTESETQLTTAKNTNEKLRQAVNPQGKQDLTNGNGSEPVLTQADIEARAAYEANNPGA